MPLTKDITTAIEFRIYGYNFASGSATFSINDFAFHGFVNLVPVGASTVTAGGGAEPATLSSLVTTLGGSSLNFDFAVNDDATNNAIDAANTLISQIIINQGTGNDVATWTQAIAGAQLSDGTNTLNGTIGASTITFSSIPFGSGQLGYIADNASKTYTLRVWLNNTMGGTLPSTIDGLNLVFDVTNASFTFDAASSLLAASQTQNSGATNNAVSVVASALTFITQATPTSINTNQVFTTLPVVEARDANGNRDLGYNNAATVTTVGGLGFSGQSTNFASGLYNFTTFQYTSPGNGTLTVTGSGSPATTATNNCVTITVVAGPCVDEGFAGGTTAPPGWTFTAIGGVYTTNSNFGNASPSLQFDNTNDAITTPTVTNPTQLSFWYKGQNSTNSYLLVHGLIGSTWILIDSIRPLATTGTNVSYAISNPYTQFRLTYIRATGNLALDDVNVLCSSTVVPTNYYQSNVTTGNWDAAGSWQTSTDNVNWVAATAAPDFNANTITIRNGHTITITQGITTDQTVVAAGGTLVINPSVIFVLNDGAGVDLQVNGTLNDKSTGSNGQYISGSDPRWELGANGTFIKEGNSSANVWQCTYQGADGNCRNSAIPATSTWIVRQTGSAVTLSSTYAYYGNLIIENTSVNAWNGNLSQAFQGGTSSEAPVIKGNLDVGGTGSNTVGFIIANTNANPVRVDGNVTVRNGSTLNLGTSGQTTTGIEVKGNINLSASGNLIYGSSSGSNRQLRLTGTAQQTISGGSTVNILNMLVSNTSTPSVVMGRNIKVDNQLTLNTGSKLNVNGYTLELAGTITGTGTLSGSTTSILDITGSGALGTLYFTQTANTFRTIALNKTSGSATIGSGSNMVRVYQNLDLEAGTLTTNGNLTTLSSALQTAYINNFSAGYSGSLSGNVIVQRYITSLNNGFRYIGAPVATTLGGTSLNLSAVSGFVISGNPGQVIPLGACNASTNPPNVSQNSPYGTFMYWVESSIINQCRQSGWWFQTTGAMTIGRGYGAKLSNGNTVIYTGAANTGSQTFNGCTRTNIFNSNFDGWNLVSNPFPSTIRIDDTDNGTNNTNNMPAGFNGTIQFYITSGPYVGTYAPANSGTAPVNIALGQGFWVQVANYGAHTSLDFNQ
ncbi:MAG: hypothetical protein M0D57_12600 [Sphingobacteriales bacterium JAD_PAG50586_3]|nr:MAG: hypothetical protein M0D57_12600 [Sphingobacteriales bacterium JAD_PAG50586_3]